ncbi:MAG: transcriptional regulator, family [Rariglobus sp.]|jgi:transcriptional regulator with XRE-family HTH domain|nr:transcriptional regulator, family [Rariglobus sp.]
MHYTQLFRSLREAKGLTLEGLAELAGCHRNTVTNVESGRPVKFKTIAELMEKMGYTAQSAELKSIALLWLEAVSGIPFSQPRTEAAALKAVSSYRKSLRDSARQLETEVINRSLAARQIDLLLYAVRHPEMLTILENVRDLVTTLNAAPDAPALKVAEDTK